MGKGGRTGGKKTWVVTGATSIFYVGRTNGTVVSDGYGNARVMAFDADTGKFKRMWGAYGNKPLDDADRAKRTPPSPIPWVAVSEVLKQFASPVHDVKVSDDGLVYLADRGNKRVQVFTLDGKFIAEQFVGLDSAYGLQARGLAFSPDRGSSTSAHATPTSRIAGRWKCPVHSERQRSGDPLGHQTAWTTGQPTSFRRS